MTRSMKSSTTAAIAYTPPRRSYNDFPFDIPLSGSDGAGLEQLLAERRVAVGERPRRLVAAQTADVHLQLAIQIVGVVQDQALRHQRQPRRAPLRQRQVRYEQVFEESQQLRVDVALFAGR